MDPDMTIRDAHKLAGEAHALILTHLKWAKVVDVDLELDEGERGMPTKH
jgi:HPt (histidine-containing phosphotransfer) domain-containing protein